MTPLLGDTLVTIGKVPSFEMINQDGDRISNAYYNDKVYVVEFFYNMPFHCPIMNQNMAKIEKEYLDNALFGIASFTINPEYDTLKSLRNMRQLIT